MKKSLIGLSVSFLLLSLVGCSGSKDSEVTDKHQPIGDGFLLRLKKGTGTEPPYNMTIRAEMDLSDLESAEGTGLTPKVGTYTFKIPYFLRNIKSGGGIHEWEVSYGNITFETDVPTLPAPDDSEIKRTFPLITTNDLNVVLSSKSFEILSLLPGARLPGITYVVFPKGRVKTGESWEGEINDGIKTLKYRYTLIGEEKINEIDTLLIESEIIESNNVKNTKPSKIWISKETGWLIKCEDEREIQDFITIKYNVTIQLGSES